MIKCASLNKGRASLLQAAFAQAKIELVSVGGLLSLSRNATRALCLSLHGRLGLARRSRCEASAIGVDLPEFWRRSRGFRCPEPQGAAPVDPGDAPAFQGHRWRRHRSRIVFRLVF